MVVLPVATEEKKTITCSVFQIPNDFPNHPGGQSTLDLARNAHHPARRDIIFLAAHLGLDKVRIAKTAAFMGVKHLPDTSGNKLYQEIDQAVRCILAEQADSSGGGDLLVLYQFWCLLLTMMIPISLVGYIVTGRLICVLVLAFSLVSYAFNIFHSRHHRDGIVYGIPWLDAWLGPVYDCWDYTFMTHPLVWRENHNANHHNYTNVTRMDHYVTSPFRVGMRLRPDQPYYAHIHYYQNIYVPILLALNYLTFPLENCLIFKGSAVYLLLHYGLLFAAPMYFHGSMAFWYSLGSFTVVGMVTSYLLQVSHNHPDLGSRGSCCAGGSTTTASSTTTTSPRRSSELNNDKYHHKNEEINKDDDDDDDLNNIDDWIRHQIQETFSWGGLGACLLLGGINYHCEHHVAPCLAAPTLYHALAPRLQEIAARHDIKYVREPSLASAVWAYHRHVYQMSLPPTRSSSTSSSSILAEKQR